MKYLLSILALATIATAADTQEKLCERITTCYIEVAEKNQANPSVETAKQTASCAKARAMASCNYAPVKR